MEFTQHEGEHSKLPADVDLHELSTSIDELATMPETVARNFGMTTYALTVQFNKFPRTLPPALYVITQSTQLRVLTFNIAETPTEGALHACFREITAMNYQLTGLSLNLGMSDDIHGTQNTFSWTELIPIITHCHFVEGIHVRAPRVHVEPALLGTIDTAYAVLSMEELDVRAVRLCAESRFFGMAGLRSFSPNGDSLFIKKLGLDLDASQEQLLLLNETTQVRWSSVIQLSIGCGPIDDPLQVAVALRKIFPCLGPNGLLLSEEAVDGRALWMWREVPSILSQIMNIPRSLLGEEENPPSEAELAMWEDGFDWNIVSLVSLPGLRLR